MQQELFLLKLSQVCNWTYEKVKGEAGSDGRAGETDERPEQLVINSYHARPCEHVPGMTNCKQKIFWKEAKTNSKRFGVMIKVTQCQTCSGLITAKGHFIPKPDNYNYALICWQRDQEE